jgi:hypothetical protein
MWFWSSYKRGASSQFWDIGQVPARNFDWLPFTPPSGRLLQSFKLLSPFSKVLFIYLF